MGMSEPGISTYTSLALKVSLSACQMPPNHLQLGHHEQMTPIKHMWGERTRDLKAPHVILAEGESTRIRLGPRPCSDYLALFGLLCKQKHCRQKKRGGMGILRVPSRYKWLHLLLAQGRGVR